MANITTNSWLSFMHSLHNIVRTGRKVTLTGLGALNEINNYLLLFFIERNFARYDLDECCKFSYLYTKYCTDGKIAQDATIDITKSDNIKKTNFYNLWHEWCNVSNNNDCVLRKIVRNTVIRNYIKNEVIAICAYTEEPETGKNIQKIINLIWKTFSNIAFHDNTRNNDNQEDINKVISLSLDSFGFDAFGDAYERFKHDVSKDSGKTTGQHFTPDVVKKYIIAEIKPKSNEVFYEPACGTGGFIHHSKKYVKDNENEEKSKIFAENLIANECNPEIYKPLAINMLIHDIPFDKIKKQDSLEDEWINKMKETADIIGANPPFGPGGILTLSEYWKVLKTGKKVIKESFMAQFLIHIYHSLKDGGRCGTVSDRGILNNGTDGKNSWQTRFRKFFLENVNLYRITLLPDDTFDYTTFSTCTLFFVKGQPTKQIEFRELTFKDINIDGNISREIDTDTLLGYITIEQIIAKNYSLKADDYFKVVKPKEDTSGWIKLGEVCEYVKYESKKDEHKVQNGKYPFYNSTIINHLFCDEYTNDEECMIINKVNGAGKCKIFYNNGKFSATSAVIVFKSNDINNFINRYIYYYLLFSKSEIESKYAGGDKKSITNTQFETILIPKLSPQHQQEIIQFLDEQFKMYNINQLQKDIPIFKLLINKEYSMAAELLHMVYRKMAAEREIENMERDKRALFLLSVYAKGGEMKRLGDVVEIKRGKSLPKSEMIKGEYPVIGGGVEYSGYHNEFNYDGNDGIFISRVGTAGHVSRYLNKCYITDLIFTIELLKDSNINIDYFYCYLKHNQDKIESYRAQNAAPNISWNNLKNLEIPIPPLEIQQEIINKIKALDDQSSHYSTYAKTLEQELSNIMETIQNMTVKPEIEQPDIKPEDIAEIETKSVDTQPKQINVKPKTKAKTGKTKKQNITIDGTF